MDAFPWSSPQALWEFYSKKLAPHYFEPVEAIICTQLSQRTLIESECYSGACEIIDIILSENAMALRDLLPGAGIYCKGRGFEPIDIPPDYPEFPTFYADTVDGASEFRRMGRNITSWVALALPAGEVPLCVISVPQEKRRYTCNYGQAYNLPGTRFTGAMFEPWAIKTHKIGKREDRISAGDLRITEDYKPERFPDLTDIKITELQKKERRTKSIPGSDAGNALLFSGRSLDIYIQQRGAEELSFFDYVALQTLVNSIGGKFTDLKGNIPAGKAGIDGFIAGSTPKNHKLFMRFVSEAPDMKFWKKYLSLERKD